jgi:hypothetical protein
VVVDVSLSAMLVARILVRLVTVGKRRMVVLMLMTGGQMRPVLAAAQVVGDVGMLVAVDLGVVAVLLTHADPSSTQMVG